MACLPSLYHVAVEDFDYAFAENGLTAYKMGKQLASQSFISWLGEEKYKKMVKFILHYIADLDLPIMRHVISSPFCSSYFLPLNLEFRGTFIEFRNGMVNISPAGRNATQVFPFPPRLDVWKC